MKWLMTLNAILFAILMLQSCSETISNSEDVVVNMPTEGEKIVNANCVVCHSQGINGAPILGNQKMWAPRIIQGVPVLVEHAINGYELMPAKGGKTHLTDEQIELAVNHMVSLVQ